jgi:hypothetical protein
MMIEPPNMPDETLTATFVCVAGKIFMEVEGHGRIAQYKGHGKWRSLKPGWRVTMSADYNETYIDHDGRRVH